MLKAHIDTAAGNDALRGGRLPHLMKELLEQLKPEAAYFGPDQGVRSCWIVFDMQDASKMPTLLEPLFMELNAEVEIHPIMNQEDLMKGLSQMRSVPH
jgi:hypothetical protein